MLDSLDDEHFQHVDQYTRSLTRSAQACQY